MRLNPELEKMKFNKWNNETRNSFMSDAGYRSRTSSTSSVDRLSKDMDENGSSIELNAEDKAIHLQKEVVEKLIEEGGEVMEAIVEGKEEAEEGEEGDEDEDEGEDTFATSSSPVRVSTLSLFKLQQDSAFSSTSTPSSTSPTSPTSSTSSPSSGTSSPSPKRKTIPKWKNKRRQSKLFQIQRTSKSIKTTSLLRTSLLNQITHHKEDKKENKEFPITDNDDANQDADDQDADQTQLLKTSLSSRVKDMRRSRSIDISKFKDLMSHTVRVVKQGVLDAHETTTKHVNNLQEFAGKYSKRRCEQM